MTALNAPAVSDTLAVHARPDLDIILADLHSGTKDTFTRAEALMLYRAWVDATRRAIIGDAATTLVREVLDTLGGYTAALEARIVSDPLLAERFPDIVNPPQEDGRGHRTAPGATPAADDGSGAPV